MTENKSSKSGIKVPGWLLPVVGAGLTAVAGVLWQSYMLTRELDYRCTTLRDDLDDLEQVSRKEQDVLSDLKTAVGRLQVLIESRVK